MPVGSAIFLLYRFSFYRISNRHGLRHGFAGLYLSGDVLAKGGAAC